MFDFDELKVMNREAVENVVHQHQRPHALGGQRGAVDACGAGHGAKGPPSDRQRAALEPAARRHGGTNAGRRYTA